MTPDHEAAKNAAKLLRDFFTFSSGEYGEREQRNLAVSYLDLVSREQRAEELLRKVEPELWGTRWNLGEEIRAFLAERGGE